MVRSGSPSKVTSVLLVGNPYLGVLAAVRALRAAGYEPWLAVYQPGTYASRSSMTAGTISVPDPYINGEEFVRELAAAATRLSVAAVLPSTDTDLYTLAGREADFAGIALGVPSRETVERATDKELLAEFAMNAGLQTPPTKKVVRGDSDAMGAFGFPAVVKPLRSAVQNSDGTVAYYSASYVSTKQSAEEVLEDMPEKEEGLLQPYIPGTLQSVTGVSWEGELICALHQISVRIWPLHAGISAYAKTIPPDAELERGLSRVLEALGWSGLFQAQFIRGPTDEPYLIDLNPRIYGSLALAAAAGLNLPGIWVDLLLGRRPDVVGYRVGVRFRHEENDVRALLRMLADGRLREALEGFVPRRHTTHAVFSLRDPMPLLTSAGKLSRLW